MKLVFNEITDDDKLLADTVRDYIDKMSLNGQIKVAEINPEFADGESMNREYDVAYEMELNCLIIEGRNNNETIYAAAVVPYGKRINMNAKVRKPLNVKEIKFASLEYVIEKTGMEYGSITPIGLPEDWKILVDETVFNQEYVITGSGKVDSKLFFPSSLFKSMPGCIMVEGLAKE